MTFHDWAFDGDEATKDESRYGYQARTDRTIEDCERDYELEVARGYTD